MRKQLLAEHGKEALQKEIKELEDERMTNLNKVWVLKERIACLKTRHAERRAVDKEKRAEEIKFLEFQMNHLKDFLKQIDEKWSGLLEALFLRSFISQKLSNSNSSKDSNN